MEMLYDTHAAIRRLMDKGMPEPHAEGVVHEQVRAREHGAGDLATKTDLKDLRLEIKGDLRWVIGTILSAIFAASGLIIAAIKLLPPLS